MRILNIGSINIDHVYAVDHFVRPGETLGSSGYHVFAGGKGFNQSVALARAGVVTGHLGGVGPDGEWLVRQLEEDGVDTTHVTRVDAATGHAIIQVVPAGENAIMLHGGANLSLSVARIDQALEAFSAGDYLLLQNETNAVPEAILKGAARGLKVAFNPAPMSAAILDYPLENVGLFILNETEAEGLTGETAPDRVRVAMQEQFPGTATVVTLGGEGAIYFDVDQMYRQPASVVEAVDTTAAGDTFIGYFLAEMMRSSDPVAALALGCRAAAICVTRPGAAPAIPYRHELE